MRTFHYGGTASRVTEQSKHAAKNPGTVKFLNVATVERKDGNLVVVNRNGKITIVDNKGREKERYSVVYGSTIKVSDGQEVVPGQELVEWDPFTSAILTEVGGKIAFRDIVEGENLREETDRVTGLAQNIIVETIGRREALSAGPRPGQGGERKYLLPIGSHLMVSDGQEVHPGDVLAKIPRETTKTKDITGGLPRIVELFEARRPEGRRGHHRDRRDRLARPDRQGDAKSHHHRGRRGDAGIPDPAVHARQRSGRASGCARATR